jgi:DNA end-binding protein Ku
MRSMWKGAVSFGLVTIPVKLYTATEQKDITFRQVHREDGGRIRFRRVCSVDGEEVPYEDVAKGYELPSGEMVILTEDDMAELPLPTSRSIEVLYFTPETSIDPILLSKSYYVEPEKSGARAYVLMRDALERSGKVAVVLVALRQRESLAALRSRDGVLVLETLLWPDEVREVDFPFLEQDIEVRSQELKMAASLIDSMTEEFDPDAHRDGYREALAELVEAKVEGRDVVQPAGSDDGPAEPVSLADALKASIAAARGDQESAKSTPARKPAAATRKPASTRKPATAATSAPARKPATATRKPASTRRTSAAAKDTDEAAPKTATTRRATRTGTTRTASTRAAASKDPAPGDTESETQRRRRRASA